MIQVKECYDNHDSSMEDQVNKFLRYVSIHFKLIDIKYTSWVNNEKPITGALIIYEELK